MRLRPETTGTFPSTYFRVRRRTVPAPSCSSCTSEMFIGFLPARLGDAGQLAQERTLPEADAAQREPSHVGPRPTAHRAAVIRLHLVLRLARGLRDHRLLSHVSPPRA